MAEAIAGLDEGEGADADRKAALPEMHDERIGPWIVEVVDQAGGCPVLDRIAKREFGLEEAAARRKA